MLFKRKRSMYFKGAEHTKNEKNIMSAPRIKPVIVIKLFNKSPPKTSVYINICKNKILI